MAQTTRNLGLPLIAAGQAQKHVTHNEALERLDALVQAAVRDRGRNVPPSDPAEGDRYLAGPAPTGAWTGLAHQIVLRRDGVWEALAPRPGWLVYAEAEATLLVWTGTVWTGLGGADAATLLARLLTVDGDGSDLDADRLGGVLHETLAALTAVRTMLCGGGTLSVSAAHEVRWSAPLRASGFGRGDHWSGQGTLDIAVPSTGAPVSGFGGAANRSATAGGLPLGPGEALYVALPEGGATAPLDAFRIVGTQDAFALPARWLCLCTRDAANGQVVFWNGLRLAAGQSIDLSSSTAARPKLTGLGIGTDPDANNALAVASGGVLFTHAGEGVQAKINKAQSGGTASLLFQTGFSGRAEFGLVGSDHVSLKVSADGASFVQAFQIDAATGQISFPSGALREEVTILAASGTWSKPAWARMVTIVCLGGGGGGGSGRRGASGSVRGGGGGGGAGALNAEEYPADELPATLSIAVGLGGDGGGGQSVDSANGQNGSSGGTTTVAVGGTVILLAAGGGGGAGGSTASGAGGSAGQNQSQAAVGAGGTGSAGAAAGTGGSVAQGAGGGGGGGGLSAADAAFAGGASGHGYLMGGVARRAASVAGGAVGLGGNGGTAKAWARGCGAGGGGGGAGPANASGSGGAGGLGGLPAGGGGGGGGSANGAPSGAGGAGARGEVWILCRG